MRVAIYIDGSNLYHGLLGDVGNPRVDYQKLVVKLLEGRPLTGVYYYNAPLSQQQSPEKYRAQQRFFSKLKGFPKFTVRLGQLERRPDGHLVEKRVDVRLAVNMIMDAYGDRYDEAILMSGDSDFVPAIEAVKIIGKGVEVAYTRKTFHLFQVCERFILLDGEFLADCFLPPAESP